MVSKHEQEKKTIERHFNSMLLSRLRAGRGLPYDPSILTRDDGRFGEKRMSGYQRALGQTRLSDHSYIVQWQHCPLNRLSARDRELAGRPDKKIILGHFFISLGWECESQNAEQTHLDTQRNHQ